MPVLIDSLRRRGLLRLFSGANVGPHFQILAIVANQCFVMVQTGAACFYVGFGFHRLAPLAYEQSNQYAVRQILARE